MVADGETMLMLAAAAGLYIGAGVIAGLLSGLFGMGGGLAVVPMLVLALTITGNGGEHVMHLAVGTSLAVVMLTSIYTTMLRSRAGDLQRPLLKGMAPPVALGALAGALVADSLDGFMLRLVFIAFVLTMIVRLVLRLWRARRSRSADAAAPAVPGEPLRLHEFWLFGTIAGIFGALLGIGVSGVMTPIMTARGYRIQTVSAMAAALAIIVGLAGGAGFMVLGLSKAGLPAYSIGYVYMPALAFLVIGALAGSPLGIRLSHRLPQARQIGLFLVYLLAVLAFMATR